MEEDRRYPLAWPDGWKRTPPHRRKHARYKVSEERAKMDLLHSLKLLGTRRVILSTNVRLRRDGLPYVGQKVDDTGVAVYWLAKDGQEQVIACDCWRLLGDNIRALGLAVDSLRQLERCGASEILNRAFRGFSALPGAGGTSTQSWRVTLGFTSEQGWPGFWSPGERVTEDAVKHAYRMLAKKHHPDASGGNTKAFQEVHAAYQEAMRELKAT